MAAQAEKDLITCHVLDTALGQPARNMTVRLQGPDNDKTTSSPSFVYTATTDADGRIHLWQPTTSETTTTTTTTTTTPPLAQVLHDLDAAPTSSSSSRWRLIFDVEGYFTAAQGSRRGDDGIIKVHHDQQPQPVFFPEAVVVFRVEPGQRYHVPLLLSPFSLTTYRGS